MPQTITLGSGLVLSNTIAQTTITGPSASLTVSGGGPSSNFSVFTVNSGVTASISGLTIANGNATGGGGVENVRAATLSSVTSPRTRRNSAAVSKSRRHGDAHQRHHRRQLRGRRWRRLQLGGTATLTNVTISANSVFQDGGGIYNVRGTAVTLTNAPFPGTRRRTLEAAGAAVAARQR